MEDRIYDLIEKYKYEDLDFDEEVYMFQLIYDCAIRVDGYMLERLEYLIEKGFVEKFF